MNESNSAAKTLGVKEYVAPKGWNEITDNEKCERLREIVKGNQNYISRLQSELHKINTAFEKHNHDVQNGGKLIVPYVRYSYSENSIGVACSTGLANNYF